MVANTFQKRGLLRSFKAQADAQSPPQTLLACLMSILTAPASSFQKGKILIGSNAGSVSASYSISVGWNQAEILEIVSELLDRYDQAKADLVAGGNATPTDGQIYDQEMANLVAIKGYTANWMYLSK